MKWQNNQGSAILDFLITSASLFCGLYFIFWSCFFAANNMLARFYLNDFSLCQLNSNPKECLNILKRRLDSIRFIEIKKFELQLATASKTVSLSYDYTLPMLGLKNGIQSVQLHSAINTVDWQ